MATAALFLVLSLLTCTLIAPETAAQIIEHDFLDCLPSTTPVFAAGTAIHANLTSYSLYNIRATPDFIVRAKTADHVASAVRCARKTGLKVCARSGGHSLVGKSLCPGVLIDVGPMDSVVVDPVTHIATIGAGTIMGELLWKVHAVKRWVAGGVCPSVGVGGYMFGGGHSPYEGTLGLACDSLVEVTLVNRNGWVIRASKQEHQELFWGLCGAGGGQFGIVTSFKMRTASSEPYDNAVVFRYSWPHNHTGELLEKWMRYDEEGGNVRIRMEMGLARGNAAEGMFGLGYCFKSASVEDCEARLSKAEFFNVPGRKMWVLFKARNALDVHAFLGPEGGWGRRQAQNLYKGLMEQRYSEPGKANGRTYQSAYVRGYPSVDFWQKYADFCARPQLTSLPWVVCELRLMKNAASVPQYNSFAYRGNNLLTHYIMGGGSAADRVAGYNTMEAMLRPFSTGVYVNYPELQLKKYAWKYWGSNLCRLRRLKSKFDPQLFFDNPQPIPPLEWFVPYSDCSST